MLETLRGGVASASRYNLPSMHIQTQVDNVPEPPIQHRFARRHDGSARISPLGLIGKDRSRQVKEGGWMPADAQQPRIPERSSRRNNQNKNQDVVNNVPIEESSRKVKWPFKTNLMKVAKRRSKDDKDPSNAHGTVTRSMTDDSASSIILGQEFLYVIDAVDEPEEYHEREGVFLSAGDHVGRDHHARQSLSSSSSFVTAQTSLLSSPLGPNSASGGASPQGGVLLYDNEMADNDFHVPASQSQRAPAVLRDSGIGFDVAVEAYVGKGKKRSNKSVSSIRQQGVDALPGAFTDVSPINMRTLFSADERQGLPANQRNDSAESVKMDEATESDARHIQQWLHASQRLNPVEDIKMEPDLENDEYLMDAIRIQEELHAQDLEEQRLARLRDCVVCGDGKDVLKFPASGPTLRCDHKVQTCDDCLAMWIASEFESKGCDGIKCPECPQLLKYDDVSRAAAPDVFTKYDQMCMRNTLSKLEEFAWCLKPGCGSGQLNADNNHYMRCKECNYEQCLRHRSAWHKGETCEQFDYRGSSKEKRDQEKKSESWIDKETKQCPNKSCGWRIQKASGCDHMSCRRCKFEFCWLCLASMDEIRKNSNTAHKPSCKYHSDQIAIAWPFNAH